MQKEPLILILKNGGDNSINEESVQSFTFFVTNRTRSLFNIGYFFKKLWLSNLKNKISIFLSEYLDNSFKIIHKKVFPNY